MDRFNFQKNRSAKEKQKGRHSALVRACAKAHRRGNMMSDPILYRKRLIPDECVLLKDDVILRHDSDILVTGWKALRPRKNLDHGFSCYYLKKGYKISRFYAHDGHLLYHYCDIISCDFRAEDNSLIVTDLLADVIIYPDGFIKVVDLSEISDALEQGLLSSVLLKAALRSLDHLLTQLYDGRRDKLAEPMDCFQPCSLFSSQEAF